MTNFSKEKTESSGLRLVESGLKPEEMPEVEPQFVTYTFLKVSHKWRKLDAEKKHLHIETLETVFGKYADKLQIFSYSLAGLDHRADLMIWKIGSSLDDIHQMEREMIATEAGRFFTNVREFVMVTKKMMFVRGNYEDRNHIIPGTKSFNIIMPLTAIQEWRSKTGPERDEVVEEFLMVGRKFSNIKIQMTYALCFGEPEYIISFEVDDPKDLIALSDELRGIHGRCNAYQDSVYICRQHSLPECLGQ